ncbi:MAG: AAA family ATPase [Patescibacteria group bacterium]
MHPGVQSWKNLVNYAFNAFSTPLLIKTLFLPWKMDKNTGTYYVFIERFAFSLVSRLLGFVARAVLIVFGLIFTILAIFTFPVFFLIPIKISREYFQNLGSIGASLSYAVTYTLDKYSRDVVGGQMQKIYGKEKALRMIERGLSKESNHNVLIVGDAGVGKTTLIKYLGLLGQSGMSFTGIRQRRVVELFAEGISPEVFDKCLNEAASAHDIVLVIENIHLYESLYERLIPYLHTQDFGIITTTDRVNYDQVLKNHPEFLSKFEKVDLGETSEEDTMSILRNTAHLEGISIQEDALLEIVRLTDRLVGNSVQPAKSLLILEELKTLGKKIVIDDVRQVISDKTNVPIGSIGQDEIKVLQNLETTMREKIVGQDEAVREVSEALRRLRTGISDHKKPAGSFLFLGPTGVGKTYTAKILAESYFGRQNTMIRFDMSEFSLAESTTNFTERLGVVIEENPLSLVFFDELEKSHVAVRNLFLQILDEGRLTRHSGRESSFKEALIIATSNAGSKDIILNSNIEKKVLIDNLIQAGTFAPEFLNRFSGIILFKPLDQSEAKKIAGLLLKEFAERLYQDKKIELEITDALVDRVASAGFDPEFGARPIKRAIEEIVENKVADYIMAGNTEGKIKIS